MPEQGQDELRTCLCFLPLLLGAGLIQPSSGVELTLEERKWKGHNHSHRMGWGPLTSLRLGDPQLPRRSKLPRSECNFLCY